MTRPDKAVLRLTIGLGVAAFVAYGFGLQMPYALCVMAVLVLCKPGPPMGLGKGAVAAAVLAGLLALGMLMVPLLESYAAAGILVTACVLFAVFHRGQRTKSPLTMVLVMAFALIPVLGVADQALAATITTTLAVGLVIGSVVSLLSHGFFPDPPQAAAAQPPRTSRVEQEQARWIALRATLIVMPVFVLALTNPSLYVAAIMKTVMLGQQAGETNARSAGVELVGSTLMGAALGLVAWLGLSLLPNLWMLTLWLMAAALWTGSAMFGARRTRRGPSFWSNALITMLILLGPAIEDSATGKSVLAASAVRTTLYLGVSLYAWGTVWALEHWRASRARRHERQRRHTLEASA
ncbi:MAG: hypothetical protein K0R70_1912 [Steroidobacteraceae bacterium]|jgi:hypothetical protein|nr:hypothetical protein [Steroidobacteraceae bacterium]